MKLFVRPTWIAVITLAIVAFFVLQPLTHQGFYISDDGEWMVIRLSAFYQSLAEGQFPVRLLGRLNNSFGYPVSNFLYPGFLYIGSLLHAVGFSFIDSVKLIMGGSIVGAGVFLYLFLRKKFSIVSASVGTTTFLASPYLLYDVYHRGSVGEVLAFLPAGMLLYAVYNGVFWLVAPAVGLLIVSHNSLALILGTVFGVVMLVHKKRNVLFWQGVLGVFLASFFWMPALFERNLTIFDEVVISNPMEYFVSHANWILIGVPILVAFVCASWAYKKVSKELKLPMIFVAASYFFALPLSTALWSNTSFSELVQFPYRFLSISVLFGPWIVAAVTEYFRGWKRGVFLFLIGVFLIYGAYTIITRVDFIDRSIGYYTTNEGTTTVHDEYLPHWAKTKSTARANRPFEFISGEVVAEVHTVDTQSLSLSVQAREPSVLQINKIYYPGWGVTVDNVLVPINWQNNKGLIQVDIPTGSHVVTAAFRETVPRFLFDMISVVSLAVYGWMLLLRRKVQ